VITQQIKAARSLLGWEQFELALQSRIRKIPAFGLKTDVA
jgi:hypothetical protein